MTEFAAWLTGLGRATIFLRTQFTRPRRMGIYHGVSRTADSGFLPLATDRAITSTNRLRRVLNEANAAIPTESRQRSDPQL
jgi:hypothetical protein